MILYSLNCQNNHGFEAWFNSVSSFDDQVKRGFISCPYCGDTGIRKAIMAPHLNRSVGKNLESQNPEVKALKDSLRKLRGDIETHCEAVGDHFAEEARAIHYGDAEARPIYGTTLPEEAEALKEEGIPVQQVPWLPDEN